MAEEGEEVGGEPEECGEGCCGGVGSKGEEGFGCWSGGGQCFGGKGVSVNWERVVKKV